MHLLIGAQFFNECHCVAEISKTNSVGNGMVGGADITATLFHLRNQTAQLLLQRGDIILQNGVDAAVEDQIFTKLLFQGNRVHTGFDFQRVQGIQPDGNQIGHKRVNVAAGM